LRSLELDEMAPNERAILQRIKEAYGIKITSQFWQIMLQIISENPNGLTESEVLNNDQRLIKNICLMDNSELKYSKQIGKT